MMKHWSILVFMGSTFHVMAQPPLPRIGDTVACGIVFYVDSKNNHGLVCSLNDVQDSIQWYNGNYITVGNFTDKLFAKPLAGAIIKVQGDGNYAAIACRNAVSISNNCDTSGWYLPSLAELQLIYKNLATSKKRKFAKEGYWTSVEPKPTTATERRNQRRAYRVNFLNGSFKAVDKVNKYHVVAVKEFPLFRND